MPYELKSFIAVAVIVLQGGGFPRAAPFVFGVAHTQDDLLPDSPAVPLQIERYA